MCLAVPGKIESVSGDEPLERAGKVNFGGILKEVNLSCVPEAGVGDYVLVHVGFAISKVDEQEARELLDILNQMEEGADQ
jgi:hydrogenase expression/formation protein HypC